MKSDIFHLDPDPGGAPAVLLLHGLGADSASWVLQLPALGEAGLRPIAVDTPGFGKSSYDGRGWSIRRMAAGMAGLLEELGTGPAHIVGLSMGGTIAQQFALDFPHLTRSLVLVSTFTVLRPEDLRGWSYFLRRLFAITFLGLPAQAKVVAERVFPEADRGPLRQMLVECIARADPRAYRRAMASLGSFDSRRWLGKLRAPALVVTGADDTTVSPARQTLMAKGIPGAKQVVVPHAGHAVSIDQPEVFNRLLLEFFRSLPIP